MIEINIYIFILILEYLIISRIKAQSHLCICISLSQIVSLAEAASRCLVTVVTSLCTRYPRPTCQALIEPILREGQIGMSIFLFSFYLHIKVCMHFVCIYHLYSYI